MSNFSKIAIAAVAVCGLAACTENARIDAVVENAPSSEVIVKLLDVNTFTVLDTVSTNARGELSYKLDVKKGQPEFVYLFYKDTKIASLLLQAGDRVRVMSDTLGRYSVEGSEESVKLAEVEKNLSEAMLSMNRLADRIVAEAEAGRKTDELNRELTKTYVDYYRKSLRYVLENSHSLTVVPVMFQMLDVNMPVFSQATDALHFASAADSLETVYPDSRYVKALRTEAEKRFNLMELQRRIDDAEAVGFPDIELPDLNGEMRKLSEVDSKLILVHFWDSSDAAQKMLNQDALADVYRDYHKKGFEIYQVALSPDKTAWAQVVKKQDMPWINVCDIRGMASPLIAMYGLSALPTSFIIGEGELSNAAFSDEASLRRLLDKNLK